MGCAAGAFFFAFFAGGCEAGAFFAFCFLVAAADAAPPPPPPIAALKSSSLHTSMPLASAALSLEPAPGPATRMSVFLDTEPDTVAPPALAAAVAWARGVCSVPVKQMVLPARDDGMVVARGWCGGRGARERLWLFCVCGACHRPAGAVFASRKEQLRSKQGPSILA